MNSKYKNFLITNSIIIAFVVTAILALDYVIFNEFKFNEMFFLPITIFLVVLALFIYNFLSKSIITEMFKSDKELDDMIKKTLHELNTPVATIQMNTKLLSKTTQDEKSLQRLERINQSCHNLLELYAHMEYEINSKIDNLQASTFDIKDVVTSSCEKFEDIKGKITIENHITSKDITTDKFGFAIVVDNLIANAIKYNKEDGFIKLSNENNILKIQDSGIGMDTKNIMKVFDKYYQEDYEHVGIGLGLNIVKEFCDTHKIDIKIDSKENVGTTFSLNYSKLL